MSSVPVGPLPPQDAHSRGFAGLPAFLGAADRAAARLPMAKRAVDIAIAGTALLFAAPFFLVVALLVRADGGAAV
jgi:lipopolysaccharide/colanic/teichoic acid biosynthesis glycosyltransferase